MGMFRIKLDQCDAEDRSGSSNEKNNGGEDGGPKFSSNFHLSSDEQINFFVFSLQDVDFYSVGSILFSC